MAATENEQHPKTTLQKLADKIPSLGLILIVLYSMVSTSAKLVVKKADEIHPIVIVCTRSFLTCVIYGVICYRSGYLMLGRNRQELKLLFLRGFLGFFSFALSYWPMKYIPFADNITILMSAPIYASITSRIFLKEKFGAKEACFVLITLFGVILVSQPPFLAPLYGRQAEKMTDDRITGLCMSCSAAILTAVATIVVRKLKNTPSEVVIFWFGGSSLLYGAILITYMLMFHDDPSYRLPNNLTETLLLTANGLSGMFGQWLFTMALQIEEAGIISLVRSLDVVNGFVTQWLFLKKEKVEIKSIIGAVIVVLGLTLAALSKLRERRAAAAQKQQSDLPQLIIQGKDEKPVEGIINPAFAACTLNAADCSEKPNSNVQHMQMMNKHEPSEKRL